MSYPTANPAAKHDLLCPSSISNGFGGGGGADAAGTIDALSSSIVQSAVPLAKLPPDVARLSTVYTYPDAPTRPKPLSRAPRVFGLATRGVFDKATNNIAAGNGSSNQNGGSLVKRCDIGVKLPSRIPPGDAKSQKNSKSFHDFMKFLQARKMVALLACDSAGRIAFVVPHPVNSPSDDWDGGSNGNDDSYYAASLYYAPMKEFLPWAKENHAKNANDMDVEEDEPGTWTPQYPPPPEEECGPRGWDDLEGEPGTWTPQYEPPPEEECGPRGWDDHNGFNGNGGFDNHSDEPILKFDDDDGPQFKPDADDDAPLFNPGGDDDAPLFQPPGGDDDAPLFQPPGESDDAPLFQPPGEEDDGGLFKPPEESNDGLGGGWDNGNNDTGGGWDNSNNDGGGWGTTDNWDNNDNNDTNNDTGLGGWGAVDATDTCLPVEDSTKVMKEGVFHANTGAAAADAFYSGLTRTLDTRADSRLYHMRAFNGWVKATQIAELDPDTSRASNGRGGKKRSRASPMRVLDLACGKGGDLGKWALHSRGLENYVGVDVARGSLVDAAIRARQMGTKRNNALRRCTFTLADLGEDVPGRKRSSNAKRMQKLLTWNLQAESSEAKDEDPVFEAEEGGGISESDRFDVVSIQFAIHYMMSTRKRARRFFNTVSSLLEVGGNLIATTIDARVVGEKLMGLGLDYHFDDEDLHEDVDDEGGAEGEDEAMQQRRDDNRKRKVKDPEGGGPAATVAVGNGVCRLKFDAEILNRVFNPTGTPEDMYGLQYTFTLVEGEDHAAGVGEAVDLPEWLTPIPALEELAEESGLKLEYAANFHEFYRERKSPAKFPMAHNALYSMKVLNRDGSVSDQEWDVSRMYVAVKFRKVRESTMEFTGEEDVGEEEMRE